MKPVAPVSAVDSNRSQWAVSSLALRLPLEVSLSRQVFCLFRFDWLRKRGCFFEFRLFGEDGRLREFPGVFFLSSLSRRVSLPSRLRDVCAACYSSSKSLSGSGPSAAQGSAIDHPTAAVNKQRKEHVGHGKQRKRGVWCLSSP